MRSLQGAAMGLNSLSEAVSLQGKQRFMKQEKEME
jgi:hypothetical protein